jgi:hypothetical protein
MYSQPYHSASVENFPTTLYPQSLGHFPAYPANVGPFHYPGTDYGVLPMNYVHGSNGLNCYSTQTQLEQMNRKRRESGKRQSCCRKMSRYRSKPSDDSYEAAPLLMNMATHIKHALIIDIEKRYICVVYTLLCYVMLCYVMLCYVMLCYVMLCYVMLCYDRMFVFCTFV